MFFKIQGELGSSVAITDDGYKKAKKKRKIAGIIWKKKSLVVDWRFFKSIRFDWQLTSL